MSDAITGILPTAAQGLLRAETRAARDATQIAGVGATTPTTTPTAPTPPSAVQPVVDLLSAHNDFSANAAVVRAANKMSKRLLDIFS